MKYIYFSAIVLFLGLVTMSNRGGRAGSQNLGSTGAPKELTVCKSCHNGPINVGISLNLLDGQDTVNSYEPGKNYIIRVSIQHLSGNTPKAYGFQLTGLNAPINTDGPTISSISPLTSNVKINTAQNRVYAEHNDRSTTPNFDVHWKAPDEGTGPVSFYAAGNGVNADNNLTGDGSAKISAQFNEKNINTSSRNYSSKSIGLYPNPATEFSTVIDDANQVYKIVIRDLLGKTQRIDILDPFKKIIYFNELTDGVYMTQFFNKEGQLLKTQRLIKRNYRP